MKHLDLRDGGFKSRKYLFSVLALFLIFLGGVLAALYPAISAVYPTMVTGLVTVTGVYLTGNAVSKNITTKAILATPATELAKPEEPVVQ